MANGRTTKLTPAVQQRLVDALAAGNYFETAARLAGIAPHTATEWRNRGEDRDTDRPPTPLYAAFAQAVRRAESDAEAAAVALVVADMATNTDSARWYLSHRYPDRWGRTTTDVRLSVSKLAQMIEELPGEEFARLAAYFGVQAALAGGDGQEAGNGSGSSGPLSGHPDDSA